MPVAIHATQSTLDFVNSFGKLHMEVNGALHSNNSRALIVGCFDRYLTGIDWETE